MLPSAASASASLSTSVMASPFVLSSLTLSVAGTVRLGASATGLTVTAMLRLEVAMLPLSLVVAETPREKLPWSPSGTVIVRPPSCAGVSVDGTGRRPGQLLPRRLGDHQ